MAATSATVSRDLNRRTHVVTVNVPESPNCGTPWHIARYNVSWGLDWTACRQAAMHIVAAIAGFERARIAERVRVVQAISVKQRRWDVECLRGFPSREGGNSLAGLARAKVL
jgi:hypothetical protein